MSESKEVVNKPDGRVPQMPSAEPEQVARPIPPAALKLPVENSALDKDGPTLQERVKGVQVNLLELESLVFKLEDRLEPLCRKSRVKETREGPQLTGDEGPILKAVKFSDFQVGFLSTRLKKLLADLDV